MNLSENEQEVLKKLLLNARSSDSVIAKELGISSVAIAKIRKKLEVKGYVLGYSAKLDFKKIGLNYFALFYVKLTPLGYNLMNKLNFEKIKNLCQRAVLFLKIHDAKNDFLAIVGFKSREETYDYVEKIKALADKYYSISDMMIFPVEDIIKLDCCDVLASIIDQKKAVTMIETLKSQRLI